jgi:hypothetical protein
VPGADVMITVSEKFGGKNGLLKTNAVIFFLRECCNLSQNGQFFIQILGEIYLKMITTVVKLLCSHFMNWVCMTFLLSMKLPNEVHNFF